MEVISVGPSECALDGDEEMAFAFDSPNIADIDVRIEAALAFKLLRTRARSGWTPRSDYPSDGG